MRDLVIARGGYVHPAASIEERGGFFRVVCNSPGAVGEPLFKVPDSLLVPIDELSWTEGGEHLELAAIPTHLSPDRAELLDMFLTIYNCAGKLAQTRHQAIFVLAQDKELAAQVNLVRPAPHSETPSLAALFLESRSYSSEYAQAGMANKTCILPLIDFMNHHGGGSQYCHNAGWLQLAITYPANTPECFIDYGNRADPIAIVLGHGFLDQATPYASSVPATLELAGFGRLEVLGKRDTTSHRADPPKAAFLDDGLSVSHFVGDARNPHYARATLQLAMLASARRRGIPDAVVARAMADVPAAILTSNQTKLAEFQNYLAMRQDSPLASMLAEASRLMLENLEKALAGWDAPRA